jgi:hypothetical protein
MRFVWKSSFSTRLMRMLALVEFLERDRRRQLMVVLRAHKSVGIEEVHTVDVCQEVIERGTKVSHSIPIKPSNSALA